ncbi:glutathione peroxidase [Variovorax sp.]|uniref:glutathione peroxidase n=1 Tax=Variovorax sp. TaxID=1871043 RepID=UPI0039C95431
MNARLLPTCLLAFLTLLAGALSGMAGAQGVPAAPASGVAPAGAGCPTLLRHTFDRLQDEKPQPLCQYAGKVVLVVNTASFCGFTRQYRGLEDLYARYKGRGLVVLGFPSNDFSQETGSNKEVAEFCENTFGVKFPMFTKSSVRGPQANALFKDLAAQSGQAPEWNFYKYLVDREGKLVGAYPSRTEPQDKAFTATIERLLAQQPG